MEANFPPIFSHVAARPTANPRQGAPRGGFLVHICRPQAYTVGYVDIDPRPRFGYGPSNAAGNRPRCHLGVLGTIDMPPMHLNA